MLPGLTLPASLLDMLSALRPCFTAPGFVTFCGLIAGLAGRVHRRTVVGMLLGWPPAARWGRITGHITSSPGPAGRSISSAWRSRSWSRCWCCRPARTCAWPSMTRCSGGPGARCTGPGGSMTAAPRRRTSSATAICSVVAAILVRLPFCSREIGLPVLARLHLPGKGAGPSKVETAAALVRLLALAFPGRMVHIVADAAYHGPALRTLPENVTWTCRIPRNAVLYDLAPPRTGKRGLPCIEGAARSAPPMTSPPPRPGPRSPSPPTGGRTSSTSPRSPACGTGPGTPGPSG